MKKADIVVIGGSAAGLTAAITARRHYADKTILIVRKEEQVLIPCGIPYIFGTVGSPQKNLIPDAVLEKNNIELLIAEATAIDREGKILHTTDGEIGYERLILATGSRPIMLPIPGLELEGVFAIAKDVEYLGGLQQWLETAKDIVVIGGGFIGIEFGDEINKMGDKNVTVVEILPHCLVLAYDEEFCIEMEKVLESRRSSGRTRSSAASLSGYYPKATTSWVRSSSTRPTRTVARERRPGISSRPRILRPRVGDWSLRTGPRRTTISMR